MVVVRRQVASVGVVQLALNQAQVMAGLVEEEDILEEQLVEMEVAGMVNTAEVEVPIT